MKQAVRFISLLVCCDEQLVWDTGSGLKTGNKVDAAKGFYFHGIDVFVIRILYLPIDQSGGTRTHDRANPSKLVEDALSFLQLENWPTR